MDVRQDLREFLTTRRARLAPQDVGLPDFGGRRRVPGLRREEVALVAGVSVEYYVRLERGNATGISESVLDGVARALQLDDAERAHLYGLVRAANDGAHPSKRRTRPRSQPVRPGVQQLLDAIENVPAIVQNGRLDVLAANRLGRTLFSELHEHAPANFARYVFSTRAPRSSTAAGPTPPSRPPPSSAPKPDGCRTTARLATSSANSPPAARTSGPSGPPTTSATTAPAGSRSPTQSSATSTSTTS